MLTLYNGSAHVFVEVPRRVDRNRSIITEIGTTPYPSLKQQGLFRIRKVSLVKVVISPSEEGRVGVSSCLGDIDTKHVELLRIRTIGQGECCHPVFPFRYKEPYVKSILKILHHL